MKPIVAAFGEHDHADAALRWATELAELTTTPLRVVSVFEPTYSEISATWHEELVQRRRDTLTSVLSELEMPEAEIVVLTSSHPIEAIAQYLRDHDARMAVIGAHGTTGPGGLGERAANATRSRLARRTYVPCPRHVASGYRFPLK